jgi:hypothetical protein
MQFSFLPRVSCSTHFIPLYLVTLVIYSELYKNTNLLIERPMDMNENSIIKINGSNVCLRVPELSVATGVRVRARA